MINDIFWIRLRADSFLKGVAKQSNPVRSNTIKSKEVSWSMVSFGFVFERIAFEGRGEAIQSCANDSRCQRFHGQMNRRRRVSLLSVSNQSILTRPRHPI